MAAMSLAACSKSVETGNLIANAVIGDNTRTVYTENGPGSGIKVNWADAESFKAYHAESSEPVVFRKNTAGSIFSAEDVPAGVTSATVFHALYGNAATMGTDRKISIDFSSQDGTVDGLADYDVMTADSGTEGNALSFAFRHDCAILRLKCINHTTKEIDQVTLSFEKAAVSDMFSTTGLTYNSIHQPTLSFKLSTPVAKGSSEYGKGTVEYRYAAVPAMRYDPSGTIGLPIGNFSEFQKTLELDKTKTIEAGKVYDVTCHAGAEEDEGGGFWGE